MLDKAHFEKRIDEIKKSMEQGVAQQNALLGHLAEAQFHLNEMLAKEPKEEEEGMEHAP
jgi:hypothetical protein